MFVLKLYKYSKPLQLIQFICSVEEHDALEDHCLTDSVECLRQVLQKLYALRASQKGLRFKWLWRLMVVLIGGWLVEDRISSSRVFVIDDKTNIDL